MVSFLLFWPALSGALDVAPRITDREMIEGLTQIRGDIKRLDDGQKTILRELDNRFTAMDKRFEATDKRVESIDKRFESIDKRFESIDKRFETIEISINTQFDRLHQLILGVLGAFVALFSGTIGFALWDRRTMIRPFEVFETKVKGMERDLSDNKKGVTDLLDALRALSRRDEKVAEVLRQFHLL